jgi:hypothetical protein
MIQGRFAVSIFFTALDASESKGDELGSVFYLTT